MLLDSQGESPQTICATEPLDAMTDPDADLSDLAGDLANAFMTSAKSDASGTMLDEVLTEREAEIRALLIETDIRPALEDMRADLLKSMDG